MNVTANHETFAARENVRVIDHLLRHTNRKNAVPNLVNARSDTEQTAQEVDNSVSSAAKIRRNPETAKFSDKILTNHAQIATQRVLYYNKPGFF